MDSERKEFERWFEGHCLPCESNWFERDADGDYTFNPTAHAWEGWQARAELGEGTPHCTEKLNALHVNHIALQAECEALRKDAERYRWMRSHPEAVCVTVSIHGDWIPAISEQLDAALDAMGKEKA
jgi:hypothetical protein